MGAHPIAPPRRPAASSDGDLVRACARGLGVLVLGAGALLLAAWLVWKVTWGLVGLAALSASTGAHAGVAIALFAVLLAAIPIALVGVVVVLRGLQRSRDA